MSTNAITFTVNNPTAEQITAITNILNGGVNATARRGRPAKTVSPEESEEFGNAALSEEDVSTDETDDAETDTDGEDEGLTFKTVKNAINKYGNMNAKGMKAIYAGFKVENTKVLEGKPKLWEPVYRKVMAALKRAESEE
jgi:hypothetical protein